MTDWSKVTEAELQAANDAFQDFAEKNPDALATEDNCALIREVVRRGLGPKFASARIAKCYSRPRGAETKPKRRKQ